MTGLVQEPYNLTDSKPLVTNLKEVTRFQDITIPDGARNWC